MLRPAPGAPHSIDPTHIRDEVASFARRGFHGPLNYYRAIDTYFAIASAPFAGATIDRPAVFLTGAQDGLRPFHSTRTRCTRR